MATKIPPLAIEQPREFDVDLPGVDKRSLEFRDNVPLYSAVAIGPGASSLVIPSEVVAFNYAVGGTVSGTGYGAAIPANNWHTNMRIPRTLPSPEVFVIDRARLAMSPLSVTVSGSIYEPGIDQDTAQTSASTSMSAIDLLYLMTTLHCRMEMEGKRYIDAPAFMLPANVGLGGVSEVSASTTNAAVVLKRNVAMHWAGEGWRFSDSVPPILTSQTVLDFRVQYQHPGTALLLQADRYLHVILQGTHGRAVR